MNAKEFNEAYVSELSAYFPPSLARHLTLRLLERYAGILPNQIFNQKECTLSANSKAALADAVKRLITGEPIQYITGEEYFYHLKFYVTKDVLIPRPETEELAERVIRYAGDKSGKMLDIGTGSGCLAITLQKNLLRFMVDAIEVSEAALQVAKKNNEFHQAGVKFIQADFLNEQSWVSIDKYDIIVSNPPYIPISERDTVDHTVKDFEPHIALFASDRQIFYKAIAKFALSHLNENGKIFLEAHQDYIHETAAIFIHAGYHTDVITDMSGNKRMLEITRYHLP